MKLIRSLAFGAMAIVAATFSSAASARADSVGVYVGSDGFGLQFSNHDRGYYPGGYYSGGYYNGGYYNGGYYNGGYYNGGSSYHGGYQDRCRNKHYRRTHRHCWNDAGYRHYGNHPYQYRYDHYPRARHAYRHHDWNRHHWRDRRDGWRDRHGWRSRGHDGRRGHHGGHHGRH